MGSLSLLARLRLRIIANLIGSVREHSLLKLAFVGAFGTGVLVGLFLLFFEMFRFLARFAEVQDILTGYLFAMFFMSLMVMLVFSTCIIAFTSLFQSQETAFLIPCPLRPEDIFLYKLTESMTFSSWAFMLLGTPLILAYGIANRAPLYFYPVALVFFAAFSGIPTGIGGLLTLLLAVYFPRKRKQVVALICLILTAVIGAWLYDLVLHGNMQHPSLESWVSAILRRISFCQNHLLPSWWMSEGILACSRGDFARSFFFLLVILSNALFAMMAAYTASILRYRDGWSLCQSHTRKGDYRREALVYRILRRVLFFQPTPLRLLVLKDAKTFLRDPGQWSQVLLFVGLLLLYILNLRNLGYHHSGDLWKSIVSFLNLSATALVLSTFTGRFVFPMLSLEGSKFWVLGLLPLERRIILLGKFAFAVGGALFISETLIILSDWMLEVELPMLALHVATIAILCFGLSAISVGLGATFPNLREDNPSKIIAGFGGTLNLMVSLAFIAIIVTLMVAPCHLYMARKVIPIEVFQVWIGRAIAAAVLIGALACIVPLLVGLRNFAKMEF